MPNLGPGRSHRSVSLSKRSGVTGVTSVTVPSSEPQRPGRRPVSKSRLRSELSRRTTSPPSEQKHSTSTTDGR